MNVFDPVVLSADLATRFVESMVVRYPRKTFGYFLAEEPGGEPVDFLIMAENIREAERDRFLPYGQYFVDHDDAGFMASPEETWKIEKMLIDANLHQVGVFHTHQRHPGVFANIDCDLHPAPELWHMLVILRNPGFPQLRVYAVPADQPVVEVELRIANGAARV